MPRRIGWRSMIPDTTVRDLSDGQTGTVISRGTKWLHVLMSNGRKRKFLILNPTGFAPEVEGLGVVRNAPGYEYRRYSK